MSSRLERNDHVGGFRLLPPHRLTCSASKRWLRMVSTWAVLLLLAQHTHQTATPSKTRATTTQKRVDCKRKVPRSCCYDHHRCDQHTHSALQGAQIKLAPTHEFESLGSSGLLQAGGFCECLRAGFAKTLK